MKKFLFTFFIFFTCSINAAWQPVDAPRNVIIMVPDGASDALFTLARWVKNEPLACDAILAGRVRTFASNDLIADSSAAATAMTAGIKTHNGAINLGPRESFYNAPGAPEVPPGQPVATLFDAAKRTGRGTGIVTTDTLTGATPAAFGGAHTMSRKSHGVVAQQLVARQPDVLLGGGLLAFRSPTRGGMREDDLELDLAWIAAGGIFVTNKLQLAQHASGRVLGIFADWTMTPVLDRAATAPREPSLPEMTLHAIRLLNQNKRGFFLMVEGGRPDHAAHANDAVMAVTELLEFDMAVAVALDFAQQDKRTLVIVAADHETGGLSLGNLRASSIKRDNLAGSIARMKVSAERLVQLIGKEPAPADIAIQLQLNWGIRITDDAAQSILDNAPTSAFGLASAITTHVNRNHLDLGWTSHQHTGGDVALYAYGPCAPSGLIDNTDIARTAAAAMRVDLDALTRELFVDSREIFPDAKFMPEENPDHLLLPDGGKIPFHDTVKILPDGTRRPLGGLAVYIPETHILHLPRDAAK